MIVSHKFGYIFIKPRKVASTSIEISLARSCGKEDIVTKISQANKKWDSSDYKHRAQNDEGYFNHMKPWPVLRALGWRAWKEYFKMTVVRNPWDLNVSWYWYKTNGKSDLTAFLKKDVLNNEDYYFWNRYLPLPTCDFYIKYERLSEDFTAVCDQLGVPAVNLPMTKNKHRKHRGDYQELYDERGKDIVWRANRKTIRRFGYEF